MVNNQKNIRPLLKSARPEPPPEPPQDPIFEGKPSLTREQLRQKLRKGPYQIPESSQPFSKQERVNLEKEIFPRKTHGSLIEPRDVRRAMRKLRKSAWGKPKKEKLEIKRKQSFLERFFGL